MQVSRGFSLIELMIVVAIMGILMAIAVPEYGQYLQRSQTAEAVSALSDLRTRLEQNYQDNRSYQNTTLANRVGNCWVTAPANTRYFTYGCNAATADTYVLTATGVAAHRTSGLAFTLDQSNTRRTTAKPAGYSSTALPANCWLLSKGSSC
jgi:type IV pilus assembly protein PilE